MTTATMRRNEPAQFDDPSLPQVGDRCIYVNATVWVKVKGTVTKIHGNGRIEFTSDNKSRPLSLARRFQKPIKGEQYGLTFVE